jgi:hypothetical protein
MINKNAFKGNVGDKIRVRTQRDELQRELSDTQLALEAVSEQRDELQADIRKVFAMLNRVEPTHECKTLNQIVSHLISSRGIAEQERDELLAVLNRMANREWQDETISWRSEAIDMQDEARDAIAKIEGGKP